MRDAGGGGREFGDGAEELEAIEVLHHLAGLHVWVLQGLLDGVDGADGNVMGEQQFIPCGSAALGEDGLPMGDEFIPMLHAAGIALVAWVGPERGLFGGDAQALVLGVVADGDVDIAITGLETLVGHDAGMGVAVALHGCTGQRVLADVGQPCDLRVEQGHVDVLAFLGSFSMQQRGEDGVGGEQAGGDVGNGDADFHRFTLDLAGDGHDTALGLNGRIVAGAIFVRAGLAVAGN